MPASTAHVDFCDVDHRLRYFLIRRFGITATCIPAVLRDHRRIQPACRTPRTQACVSSTSPSANISIRRAVPRGRSQGCRPSRSGHRLGCRLAAPRHPRPSQQGISMQRRAEMRHVSSALDPSRAWTARPASLRAVALKAILKSQRNATNTTHLYMATPQESRTTGASSSRWRIESPPPSAASAAPASAAALPSALPCAPSELREEFT